MENKYALSVEVKMFQQYVELDHSFISTCLEFSTERFYDEWIKPEDGKARDIYKDFVSDMSFDAQAVENTRNLILSDHVNAMKHNIMLLKSKTNELQSCLEDEIIALEVDKEIYGFRENEGTSETEENDTGTTC